MGHSTVDSNLASLPVTPGLILGIFPIFSNSMSQRFINCALLRERTVDQIHLVLVSGKIVQQNVSGSHWPSVILL